MPKEFLSIATQYYRPLAQQIASLALEGKVRLLGVSGAQGTGKSTFAEFIAEELREGFGLSVICLSIDDFYLRKSERLKLANNTHPLFSTRGVPGTHDIQLANTVIDGLLSGRSIQIPRFDKSIDDRAEDDTKNTSDEAVDLVILEGWCVGAKAQPSDLLADPINELERTEDPDAEWRTHINQALATQYAELYEKLDYLVFIQAPGFESVYEWRSEQERKLRDTVNHGAGLMSSLELKRFIMYYQRITEECLNRLPNAADAVLCLNAEHGVDSLSYNSK